MLINIRPLNLLTLAGKKSYKYPERLSHQDGKHAQREEPVKIGILRILSESGEPVGSTTITKELFKRGLFINERTVRNYLKSLEDKGLVLSHGKNGRSITEAGLQELIESLTYQRLDFAYALPFTRILHDFYIQV